MCQKHGKKAKVKVLEQVLFIFFQAVGLVCQKTGILESSYEKPSEKKSNHDCLRTDGSRWIIDVCIACRRHEGWWTVNFLALDRI